MADVGNFTYGAARRSQKGGKTIGDGGNYATDIYTVVIPEGKHPDEYTITNVPKLGDQWDLDQDYYADQVQWENTFPNEYWNANVRYKYSPGGNQYTSGDQPGETSAMEMFRSFSPASWTVDTEYDLGDGSEVCNTAGDPFTDALVTNMFTTTITIQNAEKPNPAVMIQANQGTINKDAKQVAGFTIAKHCGLLTIAAKQRDDAVRPWEVTYTVQIAKNKLPSGWIVTPDGDGYTKTNASDYGRSDAGFDAVIANMGFRYFDSASGADRKKIRWEDPNKDGGNEISTQPITLDENGEHAPSGSHYWRVIQRYPESDWAGCKIPQD